MRVCIEKSTGKLIEMQSDATPGTLVKNAIGNGYEAKDIEEREATDAEFERLLPPQRRLVPAILIIDRLQAAGKLAAARAMLDKADVYTRERWNKLDAVYADDPDALGLLKAIGADPNVILAP